MATPIRRYFANGAPSQALASPITSGAIALSTAGSFTGWPVSFPFFAVIDRLTPSAEIVLVTAIVGTTASITRAQDGTVAVAHAAAATFEQCVVQRDLDEANAHTNATTGVHGAVGAVVGTTDTQTLTNKTLTSPTLTSATMSGTTNTAALTSSATVTGTAVVASTGNITASVGNIVATAGSVTAAAVKADRTQAHWNSTQAINTTATTLLTCVSDYDTSSPQLSTVNGTVTVAATGSYEISGRVSLAQTSGTATASLWLNGTSALVSTNATVDAVRSVALLAPFEVDLTAGDFITLRATSSTSSLLDATTGYKSYIRVKRIS